MLWGRRMVNSHLQLLVSGDGMGYGWHEGSYGIDDYHHTDDYGDGTGDGWGSALFGDGTGDGWGHCSLGTGSGSGRLSAPPEYISMRF